ncbi:MAG: hypothetical protein ACLTR5_05775 [Oscillospiraceae bacterium]
MYWYTIGQTLTQQEHAPAPEQPAVVLLTSEELSHQPALPGLERTLHHTPPARDARVCKAEVRSDCLAGTLVLPRQGKDGKPLACGYLVTGTRVVLVDDESALQGLLRAHRPGKALDRRQRRPVPLSTFLSSSSPATCTSSKRSRTASRRSRIGCWRTSWTTSPRR